MRLRALLLALGSATLTVACGLSVGGLSPERGTQDAASVDATSGEGSAPGADGAADTQPGQGDATTHPDGAGGDASGRPDAGNDAGDGAPTLADAADGDAGPISPDEGGPESGCADGAAGCVIVPPGWTLVAFAPNQSTACPSGFQAPTNLVEGPTAGTGACGCGTCSVTAQPSCASGAVGVYYDYAAGPGGATCNLPSTTGSLKNNPPGSCGEADAGDHYTGNYNPFDIEYVPPRPTGGGCTTPGAATGNGVTYSAHDRACAPVSPQSAGCVGDACMPGLTGAYKACIMQSGSGSIPCPAGPLSDQHTVGSGVSFGCTDCGCTVSGQCTGTVTLYTDGKCNTVGLTVPADSSCYNVTSLAQGNATTFRSYTYAGGIPSSVQCAGTGTSTAQNVVLANPATICCAP